MDFIRENVVLVSCSHLSFYRWICESLTPTEYLMERNNGAQKLLVIDTNE